jgi:hypothetical protein
VIEVVAQELCIARYPNQDVRKLAYLRQSNPDKEGSSCGIVKQTDDSGPDRKLSDNRQKNNCAPQ